MQDFCLGMQYTAPQNEQPRNLDAVFESTATTSIEMTIARTTQTGAAKMTLGHPHGYIDAFRRSLNGDTWVVARHVLFFLKALGNEQEGASLYSAADALLQVFKLLGCSTGCHGAGGTVSV